MRKIKTVVIGCGNITGLNENDPSRIKPASHIGAIKKISKFNLCGVYDLDLSKSEVFKQKFNVENFSNIRDLLNNTKADLAIIAVPYRRNLEVMREIFKYKTNLKYIFCEKPMSDSLIAAKKIDKICKKNKVKLFINNRRLDNGIQKLKKILLKKKLGKLNYIEGRCSSGLYALGIHLIDTIRYIADYEFKFESNLHDRFSKKSLKFSNNYVSDDPKVIAISNYKDTYCTIINSVKSEFSYFEIYFRFEKGKVHYDQSKNYIEYEYLSNKIKRSSIDYLIDKRKNIYFKQNSIFLENYKYLEKNIQKKNNLLEFTHALQNIKIIETLKKSNSH